MDDIEEINQARISLRESQKEIEKEAKKQRIYTEMANKQLKEVIATMMSVVDYEETGSHTDGEDGARVSSEGVTSVQ